MKPVSLIIVGLLSLCTNYGNMLIAYDCASPDINITSFSLIDSYECEELDHPIKEVNVTIQLIQLKRWSKLHVYQCKILVTRTIFHCGMHSHSSQVAGGFSEYLVEMSKDKCLALINTQSYTVGGGVVLDHLILNATNTRNAIIAGRVNNDGQCSGSSYSDRQGTWNNVVVQALYRISLYDSEATLDLDNNEVHLSSGMKCPYSYSNCIDQDLGYTYWIDGSSIQCGTTRHNVLYHGPAVRMIEMSGDGQPLDTPIYVVQQEGISFSFSTTSRTPVCGISLMKTEHPRLLIHHPNDGLFYFQKSNVATEDMDMFAYINSKFVYVEHHLKTQMTSLYTNTMRHKCELEKQIVYNLMNLAQISPQQFAYSYMKSPGYSAIRSGETIHIIKCNPIEVVLRGTTRCYNDIPVLYQNQSYFITSRNHILVTTGEEVPCASMMYPSFKVGSIWYQFSPKPIVVPDPQKLQVTSRTVWVYRSPKDLAISGIYNNEDLERLREHIMFPVEKQAIMNIVAQGVTHMNPDMQTVSLSGLMDESTVNSLASAYMKKVWGWFVFVGNAVSGIMGVWLTWKLLCFVWNTVIHGMSLYQTFGMSMKLLTAISGSLSTYFLHKAARRESNMQKDNNDPDQIPLKPMVLHEQQSILDNSYVASSPTAPTSNTGMYPPLRTPTNFSPTNV